VAVLMGGERARYGGWVFILSSLSDWIIILGYNIPINFSLEVW